MTASRDDVRASGRKDLHERLDAGMERVIDAGCHPHGDAPERRNMLDDVPGLKGLAGIERSGVGPFGLGIGRPHRWTDGSDSRDEVRIALGDLQSAIPTHRDTHRGDAVRRLTKSTCLAERDQLVHQHCQRVVVRVRVPVPPATIDGDHGHGVEGPAIDPKGESARGRHPGYGAGVIRSEAVQHHDQREFVTRPVPRRVCDRVPDRPLAGGRVKGA